MKKQTKLEASLLRQKAEELIKRQPLKSSSYYAETDMFKLVHELEVHQIELEMQNEELRLAKEHIEASAEKYTELYDFAPSGYFTLSKKGEILELNIIGSQVLGKDRSYLINKPFGLFVTDNTKPIFNLFLKKIFENQTKENCEILINRKDNKFIHIFLSGKITKNGEKCLLTAIDISELKKVQIELLESEERLKVASMAAGFGTFSYYFDSGEAHYSDGFLNLYGLSAGESIELDSDLVAKAMHPDDKNRFLIAMQEANNPCGSGILDIEFRIINKDGEIRWLRSRGLTVFTGNKPSDRPIHASGIVQDITDQKNAEFALLESESKYRKLHESLRDAFVSVDMNGKIIEFNQAYLEMLGYSELEIKELTYFDLTPIKWHSFEAKIVEKEILPKGFSGTYEKEYRKKDGSVFPVELRTYLIKDNDGNPSSLWAIVRDITERKQANEQLRLSEEKFRLLFKAIPVPTYIWKSIGDDFILIDANDSAESFTHGTISNFIGIKASKMYRDDTLILNEIKECFKSKATIEREMEYTLKSTGERRFLFVRYAYVTPDLVLVHTEDFTDRKKAEKVLNDLIDKNPMSIQIMDKNGYTIKVNESHTSLFGTLPPPNFSIFEDLESKGYGDYILRAQNGEVVHFPDIYYNVHDIFPNLPDKPTWIRAVLFPLTDPRGITERFVFMHEDITTQKEAEDTLRKNNSRLELAMQTANMAWWEMDIKTGNVTFNNRKAEMLGYPPKKFKHYKDFMALVHPDDNEKAMNAMRNHLSGLANCYEVEYRIRTKSGEYKWFYDIGSIVEKDLDGVPSKVTGLVLNISNRKQAEEALQESKDYLDKIINTVSSPIFVKNEKHQFCLVNNALCKFLGQPSEELIGKTGYKYFPQDQLDIFFTKDNAVFETGVENINEELITDGEGILRTIIIRKTRYIDSIGNKFLVGIINDITERKHIEEAVHEAYQFNKQIIDGAQEGIVVYDRNLRYQVWNPFMENLTGITASNIQGKNPVDFFPFLKTYGIIDNITKALKGESINAIDFPFHIEATGKSGWASDIAAPIYNYKNEIIGVISTVRDITQKKKIEEELVESFKLFYTLFNSSPNAITLSKLSDDKYVNVNNRFVELTEYSINEIIGHTSVEFGLILDLAERKKRLNKQFKTDKLANVEVEILRKSGAIRHCLVSSELVTINHEKYILSNYHDFTERKQIEDENKKIKEALENLNQHLVEIRENERASIAREIHDQLGQSLTALKIDLKWLYDKKATDLELSRKLEGMISIVSETIKDVQRISSELRPSILDDIGLSAAIEWYCVEFSKRTGLQLHIDVNEVQSENMQLNLTIYRVLQESLTNVIRHSGAKNVIVSLSIIEKNLVLLIQDDGIGISQDQVNSLKSFGIRGMIERVKQSGGFMEIASLNNGGTFVGVHIPLK